MSAITKFFGALINVVTSLLGGIFGIFKKDKKKKKGEFYLVVDDLKEGSTVNSMKAAAPAPEAAPATAPQAAPTTATNSPGPAVARTTPQAANANQASPDAGTPNPAPVGQPTPTAVDDLIATALASSTANDALGLPKPKVTESIEPLNIPKFGPARRPGSNMKSFLDMARTVKS